MGSNPIGAYSLFPFFFFFIGSGLKSRLGPFFWFVLFILCERANGDKKNHNGEY